MDKETEFQSGWSALLMAGISIMVPVFVVVGAGDNDDNLMIGLLFFPVLTLVFIGYLFTYRGREHRSSRVGFVLSLIATALVLFLYYYVVGLAKSFAH